MTKIQNSKRFGHLDIRILILFRVSCFVLRILSSVLRSAFAFLLYVLLGLIFVNRPGDIVLRVAQIDVFYAE